MGWGGPASEVPGAPCCAELVRQGADTPFMQQAERPVPTVADAPQGSLIVILGTPGGARLGREGT